MATPVKVNLPSFEDGSLVLAGPVESDCAPVMSQASQQTSCLSLGVVVGPSQSTAAPIVISHGLLQPVIATSKKATSQSDQVARTSHSDTSMAAADSNSTKVAYVPCKVCGDKASGYHYGVTSCEGCKGFFRRSIQKQIEYRCLRDGKCLVMRLNRNRCQYCRFKKCLAVGMSRDSVRYGRVPKRSKSEDEQKVTTTAADSQDQLALESKQLAIYDIILTISQAHHANCATTEDKAKTLVHKPISLIIKMEDGGLLTREALEAHRCHMFQNLAELITPGIQQVVEFAKRVPSFTDLSQDDQLVLIKCGFVEVWLTRMVRLFNAPDNVLTMGDGSTIPRKELDIVFSADFVDAMFSFAQSFIQLHLNDTEIGLFTAVVLATTERPGLQDPQAVDRMQERLSEALRLQVARNHSADANLMTSIMAKLPEVQAVGRQHNDILHWFRQRWQLLRLPPLFAEIFDITKHDDDPQ